MWKILLTHPGQDKMPTILKTKFSIHFFDDFTESKQTWMIWNSILHCTRPQWVNSSPPVPHICVRELGQQGFRQWLVACSAPSHYQNQCNRILRNKLQWNFHQDKNFSFRKMHLKVLYAKLRPFCPGRDELMAKPQEKHNSASAYLLSALQSAGPIRRLHPNFGITEPNGTKP